MCIIADFVENIFFGTVAVATKPSDFKQEDIWSIRHINTLPKELLLHIFRFLGHGDLKIVVLVCKLWRNIGEDPVLWKHFKFVIGRNNISMIDNILETNRLQCLEHLEINGYGDKARPLLRSETVSVLLKCSASKLTLKNCDLTQLSKEDITSVISKLKTLLLLSTSRLFKNSKIWPKSIDLLTNAQGQNSNPWQHQLLGNWKLQK